MLDFYRNPLHVFFVYPTDGRGILEVSPKKLYFEVTGLSFTSCEVGLLQTAPIMFLSLESAAYAMVCFDH